MSALSAFADWRATGGQWVQTVVELLPDWIKQPSVAGARKVREWWLEILALAAPFVVLGVLARVPEIAASLRGEASIGTVAAVQGAVTGLSLIALVLAVELARRQEDRDDTVYEIMLKAAWIRPTFIFAISALLATLTAIAIVDFSVVTQGEQSANLLLCAYVLTGAVGIALLATVTRTVGVLRPTGVIGFRFRANEHDRRKRVATFIDDIVNDKRTIDDFTASEAIAMLMQRHAPLGLTATERLFAEVDDALQSQQAGRFAGAIQRLTALVGNSADQIERSPLDFSPPGQPQYGYWYPLDALRDRLYHLWQAAYTRPGREFVGELWSFEYWLLSNGLKRRSGELLELGLLSGRVGYEAAADAGLGREHAEHEWVSLKTAAFWPLRQQPEYAVGQWAEPFGVRLLGFLQAYGDMLLRAGDIMAFRKMLSEFAEGLFDEEKRRSTRAFYESDQTGPLTLFESAVLALLAIAGRAISLKERGELADITGFLEPIDDLIEQFASPERYVPAAYEREHPLREQWSLWEIGDDDRDGESRFRRASEDFVLLPLLLKLLASESTAPMPSLRGYADRFIQAWNRHEEVLLEVAGFDPNRHEEIAEMFSARLATAKAAEKREADDIHLAAELDDGRVTRFLEKMRSERRADRAIESYFQDAGRVRRISEEEWGDAGRFASAWLLPRSCFVGDVVSWTHYAEMDPDRLVRGLENGVAAAMVEQIEESSPLLEASSAALGDLLGTIDMALADTGDGRRLIVFVGNWPDEVHSQLHRRMFDSADSEIESIERQHYQQRGTYKGHWILWFDTGGEPRIAVVNLEKWGALVRAPMHGEDIKVGLEEIGREEAEERARKKLPEDSDEVAMAEQVRREMLLLSAHIEERTRFEVENPEAARLIRVSELTDL